MIDKELIKRKVSLIQDDLIHLATFSGLTLDQIASDFIKQAAVERLLERIINRALDINQHIIGESSVPSVSPPKTYRDTFLALADLGIYTHDFAQEIAKSIGTRNVLVHEYDKTDESQIYQSIGDCLRDYRLYIDYILAFSSPSP